VMHRCMAVLAITKSAFAYAIQKEAKPAALVASAHNNSLRAARVNSSIVPDLDPTSHKTFFGKDYPDDLRPGVTGHHSLKEFDHPYPAMQDTDDYENDYVKDENSDGGEWKAQMDYDSLRNKVRKEKREADAAKKKAEKEQQELDEARRAEEEARRKALEAQKRASEAAKRADEAGKKVQDLGGKKGSKDGSIEDAIRQVEKESEDLEKCKEELEKARQRLKKLMEEREKAEKTKTEAEETEKPAREEQKKNNIQDMDYKQRIAKEQVEKRAAEKAYEQQMKELEDAEAELEQSQKRLRKYRKDGTDDDGGVYEKKDKPKSAASTVFVILPVLTSLLSTTAAWA